MCQGGLGDCWLIAAISCVAEFPGMIERLFEEQSVNSEGKYVVKLYDVRSSAWARVVLDDLIPCHKRPLWQREGRPLYASASESGELWVPLLEKAFAKFAGTYGQLSGGCTSWAWQCLTGVERQLNYERADGWLEYEVVPDKQREAMAKDLRACPFYATGQRLDHGELFERIHGWDGQNYVMSASIARSTRQAEHQRDDGLVEGHAYSLLQARRCAGVELLQLRNPWGQHEWLGDWSDQSSMWELNPAVAEACGYTGEDADGTFWMSLEDFTSIFSNVYCSPTQMPTKRGCHAKAKAKRREVPMCTQLVGCGRAECCVM